MNNVSQQGGTLLDQTVNVIIPPNVVNFFNITLYRNPLIIINYWSFIHIISGVVFYKWVSRDFKLWIWVNLIFEITEFILALGGNPLFVEEFIDIVWDIILGLIGFKFTEKYFKNNSRR